MKPAGSFTLGLWYKSGATGVTQSIFQSYSDNTNANGIRLEITTTNLLTFGVGNNSASDSSTLNGSIVVADGTYHYIVVTSHNNYTQIYVDGILDVAGYTVTPTYATNYVQMGVRNVAGANVAGTWLNGQIDDLYLINGYALDEEIIRAKYLAVTAQGTNNITVTKKAIVTNVGAYSGGNTLITAYHGTDFNLVNATIASPYYSSVKVPFGFNINPNKWSVFISSNLVITQATPTLNTAYPLFSLSTPIGIWNASFQGIYDISDSNTLVSVHVLVSKSNTAIVSEFSLDAQNTTQSPSVVILYGTSAFSLHRTITNHIKTTVYLNVYSLFAGADTIGLTKPSIIFTSAYL
jgi:hypothetical protein